MGWGRTEGSDGRIVTYPPAGEPVEFLIPDATLAARLDAIGANARELTDLTLYYFINSD